MSNSFQACTTHTARKAHRCAHCGSQIAPGSRYIKTVGRFDGDFFAERTHVDCSGLWHALFLDWGDPYDGMAFDLLDVLPACGCADVVVAELNAYRGHFPHAVCRIEHRLRKWLGAHGYA